LASYIRKAAELAHARTIATGPYVGRRNWKLVWLARGLTAVAVLLAAFIGAAICLHLYDPATSGTARAVQNVGSALTRPFHDVFTIGAFPDPGDRLTADWGLAAFVYLVVGTAAGWLLRRLSWIGGRPVD
jgi:hypothetical protein